MKDKNLDDIRPARGVKLGHKAAPQPQRSVRAQVVKDVQQPTSDISPPTEEAAKIVLENNRAKEVLIEAIKGVNRLMNRRILPENRSVRENDEEKVAITDLVNAAIVMEGLSPGEGLLGMATLAVRQGLSLRDAGNHLAYELELARRELAELRKRLDICEKTKSDG